MVDIIDLIVIGFMNFLSWYSNEVIGNPLGSGNSIISSIGKIIIFLVRQMIYYFLLQLVMFIFPFLRKILYSLCLPFRWVHVYFHIYAAKEILKEIEEKEEEDEKDDFLDVGTIRSSLISGLDVPDENPGFLMAFNRFEYAKKVALAPQRFALILLLGYLIVTPLAAASGITTSYLGLIIHFYMFVAIFGIMLPSMNDWYFIFHSVIINSNIKPFWFYYSVLVYVIVVFDHIWRTNNFFESILVGTIWFFVYIIGIFIIAYITQGRTLKNPKIFWIPFKGTRELSAKEIDIQFLSLEDLDI